MTISDALVALRDAIKATYPAEGLATESAFTIAEAVAIELSGAGFAIVKVEDGIDKSLGFLLSVTREDMEVKGHAEHERSVLALDQVRRLKRSLSAELAS